MIFKASSDPGTHVTGIPAFFTATGAGTLVAEGTETRRFGERVYVMEHGLVADLSLVMQEVGLTSGATAPVQLEWSNAVHGPEAPVAAAT